jgi:predicted glycosyltransferase
MKIFIDIGHPAHVHYFRHFTGLMQEKGHTVHITARDKEVTFSLLDFYRLPYDSRGKGRKGFFGKLIYIFQADWFLLRKARKVRPDVFLSFGSPYAAHTAWLMRKPHIAFDDTDNNVFEHLMYVAFTKSILTPRVYAKDFGKKHQRFNGFMELCSLHPNRFRPNVLPGPSPNPSAASGRYIILRFVSWEASHDMGLSGLSLEDKYTLVRELSKHAEVIISSESPLPENLKSYGYSVHPARMHDLLAGALLLVSESLTMSAESAFLGTPTICISTARAGTLDEEVKLGLIELYRSHEGVVQRAIEIAGNPEFKKTFQIKSAKVVNTLIDVTAFMVWFVENYPDSAVKLKNNPEYQLNFKQQPVQEKQHTRPI